MSRSSMNTYGFDFLKAEHNVEEGATGSSSIPTFSPEPGISAVSIPTSIPSAQHKPDLEKQFDVLHFLQAHRSAGFMAPSVIYRSTGIDLLDERNAAVVKMLERNAKIRVEYVPDPENPSIKLATYAYQAKYHHVRDRASLLAQINRCLNGVAMRDLSDAYEGVEVDLQSLITAGDIIAVANSEDKDKILFPRGESFLVEMDGIVSMRMKRVERHLPPVATTSSLVPNGPSSSVAKPLTDDPVVAEALRRSQHGGSSTLVSVEDDKHVVQTDVDPQKQIRRGEAVSVGGQWYRISSAVREGPLSEQPVRAQAPLSVTSLQDLSQRNEVEGYIRPFNQKLLPLDAELSKSAMDNLQKAKAARERLHKLAGGKGMSGGAHAQLLSSNAHSTNPTTLASSVVSTVGGAGASGMHRKRPTMLSKSGGASAANSEQAQKELQDLKEAASDPALMLYSHARRHGCTRDVRDLYFQSRKWVPEDETELHNLMLEHKLLQPGEPMKRPRLVQTKSNVDSEGKPKKRRYYERKNQRMTNVHLVGTEIGAALARATEKQNQGQSVGDGGM